MQDNVIFILADDMGYWSLGKNCKDAITPNLDRLCEKGLYFENFYCASPVCSPARASILTGAIPSRHGVHDWIRSGNIDRNDPRLSEELRGSEEFAEETVGIDYLAGQNTYLRFFEQSGYDTALFGKWHLGNSIDCGGFGTHVNIIRGGCSYYAAPVLRNGKITTEKRYVTDIITDDAVSYIESRDGAKPFYMSVHYTAPHSPWGANEHPKEYLAKYADCAFSSLPSLPVHAQQIMTAPIGDGEEKRNRLLRGYFAAVSAMDAGIGKILDAVEKKGLAEKTYIVFTSDNGMNMGHHGIWGKGNGTYPQNMYETSVKVPFAVYKKGLRPQTYSGCYSHLDIYPTFAALCGAPAEPDLLGTPLPIADGDVETADGKARSAIIIAEFGKVRMIRKRNLKLTLDDVLGEHKLFDLIADPDETENLYGRPEYASVQNELAAELNAAFEKYGTAEKSGLNQQTYGTGQLTEIKIAGKSAQYFAPCDYYADTKTGRNGNSR